MKRAILLFILIIISNHVFSQVGINTTTPDASSMLDITATDKGLLIPRMTESQKNAILTPATGLLIFQTDGTDSGFYFYNGTTWDYLTANGAKNINDLEDGKTENGSIFLGDNVANSSTLNSFSNVGIGEIAFRYLTDGDYNIAIGPGASENLRTGNDNISIGYLAMSRNRSGNDNIAIGNYTGISSDIASSGNIFIGNWAGFYESSGGNKLYIENSIANANNALIYGEFDNDFLRVNGTLEVNDELQVGDYALPITDGTNGDVLTTDGSGNVSWSNPSSSTSKSVVQADLSANQLIPASTLTKIAFDQTITDRNSEFDTTNNRFVATNAGFYHITVNIQIAGNCSIYVTKNGSPPTNTIAVVNSSVSGTRTISISTIEELVANDYLEVYYNSLNAFSINSSSDVTQFNIFQID